VEAALECREEEPASSNLSSFSSKLSQSEQLLLSLSSEPVLEYSSSAKIRNTLHWTEEYLVFYGVFFERIYQRAGTSFMKVQLYFMVIWTLTEVWVDFSCREYPT
jgi:hypothetical protein